MEEEQNKFDFFAPDFNRTLDCNSFNSQILFTKRLYSPFNLCMKFIKLRDSLEDIITSYLPSNLELQLTNDQSSRV